MLQCCAVRRCRQQNRTPVVPLSGTLGGITVSGHAQTAQAIVFTLLLKVEGHRLSPRRLVQLRFNSRLMVHYELGLNGTVGTLPAFHTQKNYRRSDATHGVRASANTGLVELFLASEKELRHYRSGAKPVLDGRTLSIPAIVASARYNTLVELDESQDVVDAVAASRKVIDDKLAAATSIYGVSTGFGGSADTRTDQYDALGAALLEHHHSGVISLTPAAPGDGEQPLPYGDQIATTTMPIPWVRAAIAVRVNSVIRGHSGVRWIVIEQMRELLNRNLTPLAPLRGSISACGGKALR